MKKSKILGLSLGFTALAAVAISTPFIVTSCSKATEDNSISATIKNDFATGKVADAFANVATSTTIPTIEGAANSVTVYTGGNNGYIALTLKTALADIISDMTVLDGLGIEGVTPTFTWDEIAADNAQNGFTLTGNTLANSDNNAIQNDDEVKVSISGTVTWTQAADADKGIEEKTVTKTLSVEVTIKNSAKPTK